MINPIIKDIENSPIKIRFYSKKGGVSKGQYASLNSGFGSDDLEENIAENRHRVADDIGVLPEKLLSVSQYHSADIVDVKQPWERMQTPKADGMITDQSNIGLGILTADCGPVLFADAKNAIIGAVHSGWRGTVAGINEHMIEKMLEKGAERASIRAFLGPMIAQASYEVGEDVRQQVIAHNRLHDDLFLKTAHEGKYLFNLPGLIARRLEATKIGHIEDVVKDTYADTDGYFSYRRNTHNNIKDYGRNISVITKIN